MKKGDKTCTNDVYQTDLLYSQFHSVFSVRTPLDRMKRCNTTMLNGAASLVNLLPDSLQCKFLIMQDIVISTAGVTKLLSDLNVSKAAGHDAIRISLDSGTVPTEWKKAEVCPR